MNVESANKLLVYNRWANDRVLRSVAGLSSDELNHQFPVSYGSLQGTLVHIFGVEWCYLQRWAGTSPKQLPVIAELPDRAAIDQLWHDVVEKQDRFVAGLSDEKLQKSLGYINFRGQPMSYPLGDIVQHMVNHSTYHRGQVTFLLRMLGKEPLSSDYLLYFDEGGK